MGSQCQQNFELTKIRETRSEVEHFVSMIPLEVPSMQPMHVLLSIKEYVYRNFGILVECNSYTEYNYKLSQLVENLEIEYEVFDNTVIFKTLFEGEQAEKIYNTQLYNLSVEDIQCFPVKYQKFVKNWLLWYANSCYESIFNVEEEVAYQWYVEGIDDNEERRIATQKFIWEREWIKNNEGKFSSERKPPSLKNETNKDIVTIINYMSRYYIPHDIMWELSNNEHEEDNELIPFVGLFTLFFECDADLSPYSSVTSGHLLSHLNEAGVLWPEFQEIYINGEYQHSTHSDNVTELTKFMRFIETYFKFVNNRWTNNS